MPSKEKIEKALNNLWSSLTDVMFNVIYSQEQMQEDLRIVLNKYNYLDMMNNRKEQKIQQLETKEQKLIEKLEEDIAKYPESRYTKWYLVDCLKILKGENDE